MSKTAIEYLEHCLPGRLFPKTRNRNGDYNLQLRIGTNKGLMVRRLKKRRDLKNSFIQLYLIVTEAM